MKRLLFLLVALSGMHFLMPLMSIGETLETVSIDSVSYDLVSEGEERIIFELSSSIKPRIFILGGENPRLVIDFYNSKYFGKNVIPIDGGKLFSAIRIGVHNNPKQKTRVVVDLSKEGSVTHKSDVSDPQKLVVTLLREKMEKDKYEAKPELGSKEELNSRQLDDKPIPPLFTTEEEKKALPAKQDPQPQKSVVKDSMSQILGISFDDSSNRGEMVLFRLNDFHPPTVSAIEKDNPRVLCDFTNTTLGKDVQESIFSNGKFVERIRAAQHTNPEKVRVILDLSADRDYDLQQVFFKNDNLFVLIVNELPPENGKTE